jgi:hypothetical protein
MDSNNTSEKKSFWFKDLLNGFIVWAIAFLLYVIPAFVVAIRMGFDLGPKLKDDPQVSTMIGQAISEMYRTNPYLLPGYTVILAVLIFWRSRVICRTVSNKFLIHRAVIAVIPVAIGVWQLVSGKGGLSSMIAIIVFLAAGIAGGLKRTGTSAAQ